ncbi:MAG TPA: SpoIIE family protein phosphatase [Candidatus Eisenbacteria bacterium]|nr:SpoIIE family protein phosphatase [Candidatus Eisenbacteria bacterium]
MVFTIPSKKQLKPFLYAVLLLAAAAASWWRVFELYELQTYDWRCQLRGQRPFSKDIAVIEIEEITLENIGKWPFDREYHAQLIDCLKTLGAKAVVFDILFVEPSDSDKLVSDVARSADNVFFATAMGEPKRENGRFVTAREEAPLIESYRQAAKGTGYVNVKTDIDGKRRRVYPVMWIDGKPRFHLSLRVAMDALGLRPEAVDLSPGRSLRLSPSLDIPLDEDGYMLVSYAGQWRKVFKHYSYVQVLYAASQKQRGEKPMLDLSELKGKICFVGLSALGSHDTSPIPIQAVYPMMGLYANALNGILERDFITRAGRLPNLAVLLVVGFWILFLSARYKPMKAFLGTLATITAYVLTVTALFLRFGLWADLFYPTVLFIVLYTAATLTRALFEMKKREQIEGELKIASQIQKSFLPEKLPEVPGIDLAVYMKPAKAVGGDLYAYVPMEDGRLGVMLGDVSGKGTPAALFMAKTVSEFKFSARHRTDPAEVLSHLNDSIASESTGGLFVTLTYAIVDPVRKKLLLSNGGHLPLVCVDGEGKASLVTAEEGMPIGVLAGVPFADQEIPVRENDCFALYSDGVSEARNRKKDEWGVEALQQAMAEARTGTAPQILEAVVEKLNLFMGKADQHDDITLIIVKIGKI